MANDSGYQTAAQEFGRGGSVFTQLLDEQLAEAQRQERGKRAAVRRRKEANK